MRTDQIESPRWVGIRQGLVLIVASVALSPMLFVVEGLLPSRENTTLDELPSLLLTAAITGLALAGVARLAYAWLVHRQHGTTVAESKPQTAPSQLTDPTPTPARHDYPPVRARSP